MILSLATFAIIDAEAMANDFESPFIIGMELTRCLNTLFPSTRIRSGLIFNLSTEVVIARSDAWRMFILSIWIWDITDTEHARHFSIICGSTSSLSFSVSCLESFTPLIQTSLSNITAAATTGPARGPRPASSVPAMYLILSVKKELSKFFIYLCIMQLTQRPYLISEEKRTCAGFSKELSKFFICRYIMQLIQR